MPSRIAALACLLFVVGCDDGGGDDPPERDAAVSPDAGAPICEAERRRCTDDGVEVCAEGRQWIVVGPCPGGTVCEGGACMDPGCEPECQGRICGADGCGGVCGECAAGEVCSLEGRCDPPPPRCGDDVCNGDEDCSTCPADCGNCCGDGTCDAEGGERCTTCPADCGCAAGEVCEAGTGECAACVPQCEGRACGDDGCGGVCGACDDGVECVAGRCDVPCAPTCDGRDCGGDGCGGVCGMCEDEQVCTAGGACNDPPASCGDAVCDPDEDCSTCPADCGQCCGDGACVAGVGEDCSTCPADCGCGEGEACDERQCVPVCVPQCAGRDCGPDGCGGVCGDCDAGEECQQGVCRDLCQPDCEGRVCGGDGCGGSCGMCEAGEACDDGVCGAVCSPDCDGRVCGPDGCGGFCGNCGVGAFCTEAGQCEAVCMPSCDGRRCGDDGCGGLCGVCGPDEACDADGQCGPVCEPACGGRQCGDDGCGGVCGMCPDGEACAAGGVCVGGDGCDCEDGICVEGRCRDEAELCSPDNPAGLCPGGLFCLAGACADGGAGCGVANPTGACPLGEACRDGVCEPLDDAALCDDGNACTDDLFDPVRNGCVHVPVDRGCSDGNACTEDMCVEGVCVTTPVAGCLAPPTVEPVQSPTNQGDAVLRGTKPAGASVQINGDEAVAESPDERWEIEVQLVPGENVFEIGARDMGLDSETVTVTIVYDITPPVLTVTPDGGIYLDGITFTVSTDEPATVYYTDDGGTPEPGKDRFRSIKRFRVFHDAAFRFRARDDAGNWSEEATPRFEITGEGSGWRAYPPLPEALVHPAVVSRAASVYVAGGSDGREPQAGAWRWRPDTDWTPLPALPTARSQAAMARTASRLFVVGGQDDGVPLNGTLELPNDAAEAWLPLNPMPTTRYGLTAIVAGTHLYAFGGKTNGGVVLDTAERMTLGTGVWDNAIAPMPRPRYGHSAALYGRRIYVVGGEDEDGIPIAEVDVYDIDTEIWSEAPALPTPRSFAAVGVVDNIGEVRGGTTELVVAGGRLAGGGTTAVVEALVLEDGEWRLRRPLDRPRHGMGAAVVDREDGPGGSVDDIERELLAVGGLHGGPAAGAPVDSVVGYHRLQDYARPAVALPEGRFAHAAVEINGLFYIFGGRNFQATDVVWSYDPETGRTVELPPLPSVQNGLAAVVLDDMIYAIGGANQFNTAIPNLRRYDPASRQWTELRPMITARRDAAAVVFEGEIWVIGGDNGVAQQAVEIYDPAADRWRAGPVLPEGRAGGRAFVHGGEIMIHGGVDPDGDRDGLIRALSGGVWDERQQTVDLAWHQLTVIGDDMLAVFGGRDAEGPSNRTYGINLASGLPARTLSSADNMLTPRDRAALVAHHGRIYLLGGNTTVEVGPDGTPQVRALDGRCFNGVRDGREETVGQARWDNGGGCGVRSGVSDFDVRSTQGDRLGVFGRVEMYYEGAWHPVCDDRWDNLDAQVFCRQLHGPTAQGEARSDANGSTDVFILDDVECVGDEEALILCPALPLFVENCARSETALANCTLP